MYLNHLTHAEFWRNSLFSPQWMIEWHQKIKQKLHRAKNQHTETLNSHFLLYWILFLCFLSTYRFWLVKNLIFHKICFSLSLFANSVVKIHFIGREEKTQIIFGHFYEINNSSGKKIEWTNVDETEFVRREKDNVFLFLFSSFRSEIKVQTIQWRWQTSDEKKTWIISQKKMRKKLCFAQMKSRFYFTKI